MARMSIKDCEFCVSLISHKSARRVLSQIDKNSGFEPLMEEYRVALVTLTYKKGHKKDAGRTVDFKQGGKGYKLYYCPSCGRPLLGETKG